MSENSMTNNVAEESCSDRDTLTIANEANIANNSATMGMMPKMPFAILSDGQGDNSLEPGEVKTPTPGSSPALHQNNTPNRLQKPLTPAKQLAKEALAKALKTVSQMEAEACEEKVRAILELDAKRRKEEAEKRKLEAERLRQSNELCSDEERKRKEKEERKRLKRLKKVHKAAKKALEKADEQCLDLIGDANKLKNNKKSSKIVRDEEESEGLCSSTDSNEEIPKKDSTVVNVMTSTLAAAPSNMKLAHHPINTPHPMLIPHPNQFFGFRPLNPFMRGLRPDFLHAPGAFMMRPRAGMRGRMPFPGFRPHFYPGAVHRHHIPPPQALHRPHTPPPARGHSPILAPNTNLLWTKTKPSISYAFKYASKEYKVQHMSHTTGNEHDHLSTHSATITSLRVSDSAKDEQVHGKLKKKRDRDDKKHKKKSNSKKKKAEKSSKRKIEKIRKSYAQKEKGQDKLNVKSAPLAPNTSPFATQMDIPKSPEMWTVVENIKVEKPDVTVTKADTDNLLNIMPIPLVEVKMEPIENEPTVSIEQQQQQQHTLTNNEIESNGEEVKNYDMFADSPPTTTKASVKTTQIVEEVSKSTRKLMEDTITPTTPTKCFTEMPESFTARDRRSITPPLPELTKQLAKKTSLEQALEVKRRIDKLLLQDDVQMEAIEEAKKTLLKKTQKHQSKKQSDNRAAGSKQFEIKNSNDPVKMETKQPDSDQVNSKEREEREKVQERDKKEKGGKDQEKESHRDKFRERNRDQDGSNRDKGHEKEKQKEYLVKNVNQEKSSLKTDNEIPKHKDTTQQKSTSSSSSTRHSNKSREIDKDRDRDKDKCVAEKSYCDKETFSNRAHKDVSSNYRNPFKRSLSRDKFYNRFDNKYRRRTDSRERDNLHQRKLSAESKTAETSRNVGRFSRNSSNRSRSGERKLSAESKTAETSRNVGRFSRSSSNRSRSGERDWRRSRDRSRAYRWKERHHTPEERNATKRKLSKSSTPQDKPADAKISKTTTPTDVKKLQESKQKAADRSTVKETWEEKKNLKKAESPAKKRSDKIVLKKPLSFTAAEFLFPDEAGNDLLESEGDGTNDSFSQNRKLKISSAQSEQSPDTDDYMDNWENDDVDLDNNSNIVPDSCSITRRLSDDMKLEELDSFVTRYANPSPPAELLQHKKPLIEAIITTPSSTPPLSALLPPPPAQTKRELTGVKTCTGAGGCGEKSIKKTELFGMQEIYDQFIKSVEASGVDLRSTSTTAANINRNADDVESTFEGELQGQQSEDPLSMSSTSSSSSSTSSDESSSSCSSSSSSSSSSSASSSDDSNDASDTNAKIIQKTSKCDLNFEQPSPTTTSNTLSSLKQATPLRVAKITEEIISMDELAKQMKEASPKAAVMQQHPPELQPKALCAPKIPSNNNTTTDPIVAAPSQPSVPSITCTTTSTPAIQSRAPRSDATKDFKNLKNLEANLARIQMMRANYDSSDEISEELHKIEMLLLKEKKLILQKYSKPTSAQNVAKMTQPIVPVKSTPVPPGPAQFIPSLQRASPQQQCNLEQTLVVAAAAAVPMEPAVEPNRIFDANREAIKLTISPLKLSKSSTILKNANGSDEMINKAANILGVDNEEMDFTDKLLKPVKEVAIVKPIMEFKEQRSRESQRHHRSPVHGSSRDRVRSPSPRYRDRSKRSSSRSRYSPQRRGRGRSLSISPPRRGNRYSSPSRRSGQSFRVCRNSSRRSRSRSRSRSPNRQQISRRAKDSSPPQRRRRGTGPDNTQLYYKKMSRLRNSRSRSPQRPRSPRTPPSRRRSYSPDRYSRSPLPFKPPSPPSRRSVSPLNSPASQRSRSPTASSRFRRRDESYDRHSSLSPSQYYITETSGGGGGMPSGNSSYYYNVSPNRISLDARINIVLNGPPGSAADSPQSYESYSNYGQFGSAAYMSVPPQPIPNDATAYYANPYVPLGPNGEPLIVSHLHASHPHSAALHSLPYSEAAAVLPHTSHHLTHNNIYYNEFNTQPQVSAAACATTSVLRELPKAAAVAVQKGNVLEIVPSNTENLTEGHGVKFTNADAVKTDKCKSVSWKDEVNSRHIKSAVLRLKSGADSNKRSILKRAEGAVERNKFEKNEKKKVYFEDGIYPSRDSEDEDRTIIENRIKRKVLRLRKKRGLDVPGAREIVGDMARKAQLKIDPSLERLPCPPPPPTLPPAHLEQPIYLKSTPVSFLYYHYDPVVHSMYVSNLERPIPPRLLNSKNGGGTNSANAQLASNASPSNGNKKDSSRNMSTVTINSTKLMTDSINSHSPIPVSGSPILSMSKMGVHVSPQMSPLHNTPPPLRNSGSTSMGFIGMRINNFMRLPPSPLTRTAMPPKTNLAQIPVLSGNVRHQTYTSIAPTENNITATGMLPTITDISTASYNATTIAITSAGGGYPIPSRHIPSAPAGFFMPGNAHTSLPPHAALQITTKQIDQVNDSTNPQAMIAPYNVKNNV